MAQTGGWLNLRGRALADISCGMEVECRVDINTGELRVVPSAMCIRDPHRAGPCNGYPRPDCPGYDSWQDGLQASAERRAD